MVNTETNLLYDYNSGMSFRTVSEYEEWHSKELKDVKSRALGDYKKYGRLIWHTQVELYWLTLPRRLGPKPIIKRHYEEDE